MYSAEKRHAYYIAHRAESSAQSRAWAAAHPTELVAYRKAYRLKHRDRLLVMDAEGWAKNKSLRHKWQKARSAMMMTDLRALKLLRGCIDCGYDNNADGLQFDHVRGTKVADVTALVSSRERLIAEIAKCDVRCATCHAIITQARRRAA